MKLIFDDKFKAFMEIAAQATHHYLSSWIGYNRRFVKSGVPTVASEGRRALFELETSNMLNSFQVYIPSVFPSYYHVNYLGWFYREPQEFTFDKDPENSTEDESNIKFVLFDHSGEDYSEISMSSIEESLRWCSYQVALHYEDYLRLIFSLKTLHELDGMEGDSRSFIDGKLKEFNLFPYTSRFKTRNKLASSYICDAQYKLEAEYTKYED